MKAIMIVEKNGKKYGYGLSAKAGMNEREFLKILYEMTEGYKIVSLNIK